jgi:hypothetical protein
VGFLKSEVLLLHSLKDLLTKQISVKLMGWRDRNDNNAHDVKATMR